MHGIRSGTICLLIFIITSISMNTSASGEVLRKNTTICECKAALMTAVKELVKKDFFQLEPKFKIVFTNDFLYRQTGTEYQCMTDILIIVYDPPFGKIAHGALHAHWSRRGELKLAISATGTPQWHAIDRENDPKIKATWCNFNRTVYPNASKDPQCQ